MNVNKIPNRTDSTYCFQKQPAERVLLGAADLLLAQYSQAEQKEDCYLWDGVRDFRLQESGFVV